MTIRLHDSPLSKIGQILLIIVQILLFFSALISLALGFLIWTGTERLIALIVSLYSYVGWVTTFLFKKL
jgi:hypothetical protein